MFFSLSGSPNVCSGSINGSLHPRCTTVQTSDIIPKNTLNLQVLEYDNNKAVVHFNYKRMNLGKFPEGIDTNFPNSLSCNYNLK